MLNKLTNFGDSLTLVPDSGIQFIDYGFDIDDIRRFERWFIERPLPDTVDEKGEMDLQLIPNWNDIKPDDPQPLSAQAGDSEYSINKVRAIEPFLNKWVPVPLLRVQRGKNADGTTPHAKGPNDWARMRIVASRDEYGDEACTHRIVFAIDTSLVKRIEGRPYLGPSEDDVVGGDYFDLAYRMNDIGTFLKDERPTGDGDETYDAQVWLIEWVKQLHLEFLKKKKGRELRPDDIEYPHEATARYISLLQLLGEAIKFARIKFVDTIGSNAVTNPVNVDLVLDIGNSRSCGIVIQAFPDDESVNLDHTKILELRDLEKPELIYKEPFESHVELAQGDFGPEHIARGSQRDKAFYWPSMVRLGPEAARYRRKASGNEAVTGMSSPKRYLWDIEPVNQDWNFRNLSDNVYKTEPPIQRAVYKYVNRAGDVLSQLEEDRRSVGRKLKLNDDLEGADRFRFSRSSFFTFMVMEIIAQTISMINSPALRADSRTKDAPRRLRQIILTIPSAMPIQEQRIIRSRTNAAIKLLWSLMGWDRKSDNPLMKKPVVNCSWDEASSMHLVYLFGETTRKMGGDIRGFMDLIGRPRAKADAPDGQVERSVRLASVDIGGGTTDLMISTYFELDNRAIIPQQDFREGFRKAGDDLVKEVINRVVIPSIVANLEELGMTKANGLMLELFSGSRSGMSELERYKRRQFVSIILQPAALGVLSLCEAGEVAPGKAAPTHKLEEFFDTQNRITSFVGPISDYLLDPLRQAGLGEFDLREVPIRVDPVAIDNCVKSIFEPAFANLAEAINHFDADMVLITGRPSRLPQLVDLLTNTLAVSTDRVVAVRDYRVGSWYPFREVNSSTITDPKTTAVVGGMLCALSERNLVNFTLYTDRLSMKSTAKYIGELEPNEKILNEKVYFSDVDLDNKSAEAMQATFSFHAPVQIGYRQLPYERWVTNPLYKIQFASAESSSRIAKPLKVTVVRNDVDKDDDDADRDELMTTQAALESFVIDEVIDANDSNAKGAVIQKLHTMRSVSLDQYWLDTGEVMES